MNFDQIITDLKNKIYNPVYFLSGEEPYYIDKISDFIEKNVLPESEKTFNQLVHYGKDTDITNLINTARRFPMMSNQQVVMLKEAQNIKEIEKLVHYVENPLKSTLLVIAYKYKKLDKRTKLYKALQKNAVFFESSKLYDDKIPAWIHDYLRKRNYELEPGVGQSLTDFLGNDLSKIVNELEKLIIVLPEGSRKITAVLVEKNIGISKDFNNFELQRALTRKNSLKANRIILYFCNNPGNNPLTLTLVSLYIFFSKVLLYHFTKDKTRTHVASILKVNPFFVQEYQLGARSYSPRKLTNIISLLRDYDLRSKGVGNATMSDCELLRELIYKILH